MTTALLAEKALAEARNWQKARGEHANEEETDD